MAGMYLKLLRLSIIDMPRFTVAASSLFTSFRAISNCLSTGIDFSGDKKKILIITIAILIRPNAKIYFRLDLTGYCLAKAASLIIFAEGLFPASKDKQSFTNLCMSEEVLLTIGTWALDSI